MINDLCTIYLSGRPPVVVVSADWPLIAEASYRWHDSEFEFQSNNTKKWWIKVRQHADGRALVYAGFTLQSCYDGLSSQRREGLLLPAGTTAGRVCDTITCVCGMMDNEGDDPVWDKLRSACIEDMPPETLV